jgi:hypothetical protein
MAQIIEHDKRKNIKKEAIFGDLFGGSEKNQEKQNKIKEIIPSGDIEVIRQVIDKGTKIDDPELLTTAIVYSRADVVELLLENGADSMINEQIKYGMTPIILLINNVDANYLPVFSVLVNAGADTMLPDDGGNSPLHWSVIKNNVELVASLVHNSKNPIEMLEKKNGNQMTPLDLAKQRNNKEMVKYLREITQEKTPIDFFTQKIKRLKKKPTPAQLEELKDAYEDLREENFEESGGMTRKIKNKMLDLLEEMGLIEYEAEEDYQKK